MDESIETDEDLEKDELWSITEITIFVITLLMNYGVCEEDTLLMNYGVCEEDTLLNIYWGVWYLKPNEFW